MKNILKKLDKWIDDGDKTFGGRISLIIGFIFMLLVVITWGLWRYMINPLIQMILFIMIWSVDIILVIPFFLLWIISGKKLFFKLEDLVNRYTNDYLLKTF